MSLPGQPQPGGRLNIVVVYSPQPRMVREWVLALDPGAVLEDALRQAPGLLEAQCRPADLTALAVGVWGKPATLTQALRDQDRVEVYRALKVDPKLARRERFAKQGRRAAGLFTKK